MLALRMQNENLDENLEENPNKNPDKNLDQKPNSKKIGWAFSFNIEGSFSGGREQWI